MINQFSRTELVLGKENMNKLKNARIAVFGVGGVGGYVVEALARSGVSNFDLIDKAYYYAKKNHEGHSNNYPHYNRRI